MVGVPINVFYKFQRQRLALSWREWLTTRIMELYYSNRNYYTLEASKEIDNPDQRIAEDVRAFTKVSQEAGSVHSLLDRRVCRVGTVGRVAGYPTPNPFDKEAA